MSGIFGILRCNGDRASAGELERMGAALAHRGPDGRRFMTEGAVGLGHCLLRVNREDLFERQPLRDRDAGLTLVADCRIDNREELARTFGIGASELSRWPDSALILRAYKTWGEDCARHLLGDFAFAIWDRRAGTLVLGRDHMGQRYVHYHQAAGVFVFATDLNALWAVADVPKVPSETEIGRMFLPSLERRHGATLYDGINGLTAATVLTVRADGESAIRRFWQPAADPAHVGHDEAYYVAAYRRILGEAVACRVGRTLGQPGMLFSGGYDSAALAGLAGPTLRAQGRKLVAVASVMPEDYRGSIRHARPWVDLCRRDMAHLDVRYVTREGRSLLSGLERALAEGDSGTSPYHFVFTEMYARLAAAGVRLVMDGHGGDFTLNPRGTKTLAYLLASGRLRRFVKEFRASVRQSGGPAWSLGWREVVYPLLPDPLRAIWRRCRHGAVPLWDRQPINAAFAAAIIAKGQVRQDALLTTLKPAVDARARMRAMLARRQGAAAPGGAGAAARHGLELSRPFLDKRVVELALAVPQELDVRSGRNRYLACAALRDLYPPEFQNRGPHNDDEIPDFQRMVKSVEPQLLRAIARLEASQELRRVIDFDKIRGLLGARAADDHNSGWEQDTQLAIKGFLIARFLESRLHTNRFDDTDLSASMPARVHDGP
jgi:asparagine synthase (glutamine-hydrolysing)